MLAPQSRDMVTWFHAPVIMHLFHAELTLFHLISTCLNLFRHPLIGCESRQPIWTIALFLLNALSFTWVIHSTKGIRSRQGFGIVKNECPLSITWPKSNCGALRQTSVPLSKKIAPIPNKCQGDETDWDVPQSNEKVSIRRENRCIIAIENMQIVV